MASHDGIRKLQPVKPRTPDGVVELLRALLERAERGELLSLVLVAESTTSGEMHCARAIGGGHDYFRLIGALEHEKSRLVKDLIEKNNE